MWVVRVDHDLYVRSAYGPDNPRYRRAKASGAGRIRSGGVERDVTFAEPAADVHVMQKRELGTGGLEASALGLGCMGMGAGSGRDDVAPDRAIQREQDHLAGTGARSWDGGALSGATTRTLRPGPRRT